MNRRDELDNAIDLIEAQRSTLGDAAVDASIAAVRQTFSARGLTRNAEQRKSATVLFADLVDFARLAEARDPEDVREIQRAFFSAVATPIKELGGVVEKYIGDAVMAVFGVPESHEDDAERALRAAIAMQSTLAGLNIALARTHGVQLAMRIGIHTGLVVATGDPDSRSFIVSGDTVNLTYHLQEAAQPDAILVSDATQRLVAHAVEMRPAGTLRFPRRRGATTVYQVLHLRADAEKQRGVAGLDSPLVGRQPELAALAAALVRLYDGSGGFIAIAGEAGIGKSRLLAELRKLHQADDPGAATQPGEPFAAWTEGRCLSYNGAAAYHLWRDLLLAAMGASLEDTPERVADSLRRLVANLCPDSLDSAYALLARLMSLPLDPPWGTTLDSLGPQALQQRTFEAVENAVGYAAQDRPLVMVCEDLHWADPSSLALLEHLIPLAQRVPLLLICLFRPEPDREHAVWRISQAAEQHLVTRFLALQLQPLSAGESESLLTNLIGQVLPPKLAWRVLGQAEGNPFYLEEIVRSLIISGALLQDPATHGWRLAHDVAEIAIPETLLSVLSARIDRLDNDQRQVLQMAAVIGRIFPYRVLAAVAGDMADLDQRLKSLVHQELVRPRAGMPEQEYIFKHVLTQEAAYNSALKRQRQFYHRQTGEALESLFPERLEEQLGLLAHHWERSDEPSRATSYLLRAGDRARLAYAREEAADYYQRALDILRQQGDDEASARTLMRLGLVHAAAFDFPRANHAYEQSFVLWSRSAPARQQADLLPPAAQPHRRMWGIEPKDWDPNPTFDYEIPLFSGLLEESDDLAAVPDIAARWELLDGGRTYVFHLRDDARWSDGHPVTADDFEFAWKRLLDPAVPPMNARRRALDTSTGLRSADPLHAVRGAQAYHQGQTDDPETVGVRAVDPLTLVVELERPTAYWLHIMANPATFPVPRHHVEQYGDAWCDAETIVTNGPYLLDHWHPRRQVDLVRNPHYHGRFSGNAQRVELLCLPYPTGWPERLALYEAGELDYLFIGNWPVEGVMAAGERRGADFRQMPSLHTTSTCFNVRLPPFDDAQVRRAFAMATDIRSVVATGPARNLEIVTGGFLPAAMAGYSPNIALRYDPEQARALLAEAGFPDGRGFPDVRYYVMMTPGSTTTQETMQRLEENLGVSIHLEILEWRDYHRRLEADPPHIGWNTWAANYPDPDDFLRVAYRHIQHYFGWRDEQYESLVEEARTLMDQTQRMKLYRQADAILVREAAIVPFMHSPISCLIQPWVERLVISPLNNVSLWTSLRDVVIRPH